MRIPHWPVLICGLLAAMIGQTAYAFQDGYMGARPVVTANGAGPLFSGPEAEDGAEYAPVQYVQESPAAPGYGGAPGYGTGYEAQYWPETTPFTQHDYETYQNDAGVWMYEAPDEDLKATFSLEFLIAWGLKPGNQLIGGQDIQVFPGNTTVFPVQRTTNINDMKHYGVKVRYGWENADGSGLMASAFYVADRSFTTGPNTIYQNPIYGQPNPPFGIQALASIAFMQPGVGAVAALYDKTFEKTYDQQVWGADVELYAAPFFRRPSFRMQMTYGVKWVRVFESMNVRAVNSNLSYAFDATGAFTGITSLGLPEYQTIINSEVVSQLVGPDLAIKYDLGGDTFKIWGQTKVAVTANMDNSRVYGQNAAPNTPGVTPFTTFNNTTSHVHISPIFQQSIYGEFPAFSIIPVINRLSFINRANFRIGFDYLLIGEMARPAKSITYTSGSPTPNADRSIFALKTLSFAVDWNW